MKYIIFLVLFASCTNNVNIKNEKKGKLTATYQLVVGSEKRILLDDDTAPKPPYMQMIRGANGEQILTFLNPHMNAIYFYDYEKAVYIGKVEYERQGPDEILRLAGYFIKSMDSIYVYNRALTELALTDSAGHVKQRISLRDNREGTEWSRYYPQYLFSAVNQMIEYQGKLILTGLAPFFVADSLIQKFKFSACFDFKSSDLEFIHTYPEELYGSNVNWQDPMYMQPYREFSPIGEWIYSFPVSHNLYIANNDSESYKTVYAGSNIAGTIHSIDDSRKRTPNEVILTHILQQDLYAAILHDPYRHVYYRFMLKGISNATVSTRLNEKPVVVIMIDEQFNYLGETVLGSLEEWNWENSFVTPEGLMIEFIDLNVDSGEEYLIFKTLNVEKISP